MSTQNAGAQRVALVTGAAGGIGVALVRRLAEDGFRVVASALTLEAAAESLAGCPGEGHAALACDVSDEAGVDTLFAEAASTVGAPDVLVTAAGILLLREGGQRPPITETTLDEWEAHHAVNARGTFLCVRAYLRHWEKTGTSPNAGRVVTFSSVAAQLGGYRASSAYIASKGSVLAFTKAAAREAASLGITVNAVAPGLIDAPMLRLSLPKGGEAAAAANIPLGRIGQPDDVAGAVSFLLSKDAAYLTGGVIDVNGGYRMQ